MKPTIRGCMTVLYKTANPLSDSCMAVVNKTAKLFALSYGCMAVFVHSTANPLSDRCMAVVYKTAECTPIPIVVGNE